MEYAGFFALALVLCYSAYPGRVRKLEKKLKLLNSKLKGENKMSKLLEELIGKKCKIRLENNWENEVTGTVAGVDDEWIKVEVSSKKNSESVTEKIYRIDSLISAEIVKTPLNKS